MKTITTRAAIEHIPEITAFVDQELEACGCPLRPQMQLGVAIDELASNIARYAYGPDGGDMTVGFEFEVEPRVVTLTFTDCGIPYNPLEKADPDISLPAEERSIGGLGIYMAKKNMDDMQYRRENGKNILTLRKSLVPKPR